jgi:hypothetical protein
VFVVVPPRRYVVVSVIANYGSHDTAVADFDEGRDF